MSGCRLITPHLLPVCVLTALQEEQTGHHAYRPTRTTSSATTALESRWRVLFTTTTHFSDTCKLILLLNRQQVVEICKKLFIDGTQLLLKCMLSQNRDADWRRISRCISSRIDSRDV